MAQDNRLVQEFQENGLTFDLASDEPGSSAGATSLSGLFGGIMPYRQAPGGGLLDGLADVSGLDTPGESDNVNKHPINRVAVFENEIHNLAQGVWRKQNAFTGEWELVARFDDAHSNYQNIGLYAAFDSLNNKNYLATAYALGSFGRDWRGVKYCAETNVVTSGDLYSIGFLNSNTSLATVECQDKNLIYFAGRNEASSPMVFNATTLQFNQSNSLDILAGNVHRPVDLCSYSGQIYMLHREVASGSGIITISTITTSMRKKLILQFEDTGLNAVAGTLDDARARCLLFVDNCPTNLREQPAGIQGIPSMWAYYQTSPQVIPSGGGAVGAEGFSVWQIQGDGRGNLSVVSQMDNIMGEIRTGIHEDNIPTGNGDQAVISVCDNYPGWFTSSPERPFLTCRPFGGEPGQTFLQWDFHPNAGISPNGAATQGGPAKVSFSQDKLGGGLRWSPPAVSTTTGKDVNIFDIVYQSGHLIGDLEDQWRIYYKLMPSTAYHAGTIVNVRWYYDKFHAPNKRCVLSNTSHGTLASNEVTGIVMASGLSYSVDWNFPGNNLQKNQGAYICGLTYISGADIGDL